MRLVIAAFAVLALGSCNQRTFSNSAAPKSSGVTCRLWCSPVGASNNIALNSKNICRPGEGRMFGMPPADNANPSPLVANGATAEEALRKIVADCYNPKVCITINPEDSEISVSREGYNGTAAFYTENPISEEFSRVDEWYEAKSKSALSAFTYRDYEVFDFNTTLFRTKMDEVAHKACR